MSMKKISLCIPTYNRCAALEELIRSIACQNGHSFDVEVCISDNASTDDTEMMIDIWSSRYSINIRYNKNKCNIGPDRNYLAAVALATGEYCWLMGSDDALSPDALKYLENYIDRKADIILVDRVEMDFEMKEVTAFHRRWIESESGLYFFSKLNDHLRYFEKCNSLGGVFSYLSSIIVRRELWEKVIFDEKFIGSAYAHVFCLFDILTKTKQCCLQYIAKPIVLCRGGNDFFAADGLVKRIEIDLAGYTKLANNFYTVPEVKKALLNVLARERPWFYTSLVVGHYGSAEDKKRVQGYYAEMDIPKAATKLVMKIGTTAYFFNNFVKKILSK